MLTSLLSTSLKAERAKNPVETKRASTAIWAGILMPGLGHLYAGRLKTAGLAFGSVTAVFLLGVMFADYRIFAFTGPLGSEANLLGQIMHRLPLHLLPECGNFVESMILWLMQPEQSPELSRSLRLPIATEHLGLALTALAGVMNCFFAADAGWAVASKDYFSERQQMAASAKGWRGHPALVAFLAWVVPGLGHFIEGRRKLAYVMGGSLLILFALGLYFSGFCGVDRSQLYWWWAAEFGMGGPTFLCNVILGPMRITQDIATIDLGITLLSVAGLLNLVAVTDAFTIAERRSLGLSSQGDSPADRAHEEGARS